MLRRTRKCLSIARDAVVLSHSSERNASELRRAAVSPEGALKELAPLLREWAMPKGSLPISEVVIDDEWCRFFMVTAPANASKLGDLEFAASQRFESLFEEAPGDWTIVGDWRVGGRFMACALCKPLLEALRETVVTGVETIRPATIHYCNKYARRLRHGNAWLMTCGASRCVVTAFEHGLAANVHRAAFTPDLWQEAGKFTAFLKDESLRLEQPMPEQVLVCGRVPVLSFRNVTDMPSIYVERDGVCETSRNCNASHRLALLNGDATH